MMTAIGVILSLALIAWLIWRAATGRGVTAHLVMYAIASICGVFTYSFFLGMDVPNPLKVFGSIIVGALLIVFGAWLQSRRQAR